MKSFLQLFLSLLFSANVLAYSDILTHGPGSPPLEVYSVSLEAQTPDQMDARILAEERRSEAAGLAALARQRSKSEQALDSLIGIEKLHAASVADILG